MASASRAPDGGPEPTGARREPGSAERGVPRRWALALLVTACWLPFGSYWQSDDFIAMHHVQVFGRVLGDFAGAQYDMPALVLFYRPLITLSFWFDSLFGEHAPAVAHLSNAIAHGVSAMLLASIVGRFLDSTRAWAAGLVWGLAPSHAGSVLWGVGRVDCHTTVWILLAVLLLVQWCQGDRRSRTGSLVCFVLALCSKETAMVLPGIAGVMGFVCAPAGAGVRGAVRAMLPYLLLLAGYLALRLVGFGGLGGYEHALDPGAALAGFGRRTAQLLNPLLQPGHPLAASLWAAAAGFTPAVLALAALWRGRRFGVLGAVLLLLAGCSVPLVPLLSDIDNPKTLRVFYLPYAALSVLVAAWGWRSAIPALLVAAVPFAAVRADYQDAWRRCAAWHRQLLERVPGAGSDLNFVAGLPRENAKTTALELHLGVDRLLRAPWATGAGRLFAFRPLSASGTAFELGLDALPFGAVFAGGPDALTRHPPAHTADLRWTWSGPEELTLPVLDRMARNHLEPNGRRGEDPAITLPGVRSRTFRVTVFTAGGYVTTHLPDRAAAGAPDGRIEIGELFMSPAGSRGEMAALPLRIATALDLDNRFPVLIEADTRPGSDGSPAEFRATHATRTPAWLWLDREFAAWWTL